MGLESGKSPLFSAGVVSHCYHQCSGRKKLIRRRRINTLDSKLQCDCLVSLWGGFESVQYVVLVLRLQLEGRLSKLNRSRVFV